MALKPPRISEIEERRPFRPRVFVIQEVRGRNVASAMDFGSIEPVLAWDDEAGLLNIPQITYKIKKRLATITPHDWLVLMGNPVAIGIACAVASDLTGGRFKVLKWDQQETRYLPLEIDLNRLET